MVSHTNYIKNKCLRYIEKVHNLEIDDNKIAL